MEEVKNAAFNLESYKILNFSLKEVPQDGPHKLRIDFDPKGKFIQNENKFILDLGFKACLRLEGLEEDIDFITAYLSSSFIFNDALSFEEIPPYFYRNSLGIIFPYLRAFISTLTFQANVKLMILPLLNLTNLEKTLLANTKVIPGNTNTESTPNQGNE